MAVNVGVLIPFRPDGAERTRNLTYVLAHYAPTHWRVSVADDGDRDGLWCKAKAIANAQVQADVYVVTDGDVFCDLDAIRFTVEVLTRSFSRDKWAWAMPHRLVTRLNEDASRRTCEAGELRKAGVARSPYRGFEGGGIVVLTRDALRECPPDPRFLGWGDEDEAWGYALRCLYGEPWRGEAQLYHLWHPPALPGQRRSPRPESKELLDRYYAARADPTAMRALLAEPA